jgi:hypothetical protein
VIKQSTEILTMTPNFCVRYFTHPVTATKPLRDTHNAIQTEMTRFRTLRLGFSCSLPSLCFQSFLGRAHEGRSAADCLARSRSARDLPQNLAGEDRLASTKGNGERLRQSAKRMSAGCGHSHGNKTILMGT